MTLSTRKTVRQEILRKIGGIVEPVTSGSDTTVVSNNLQHRYGSDNFLVNWLAYLPDQTSATARQRRVTAWDDSTGTITVEALGETPAANEDLELYPPGTWSAPEINDAIDRCLQETKRIVWSVLPTLDDEHEYSLRQLPWVDHVLDVKRVFRRRSPNLVDNESFEYWGNGTDEGLNSWTLNGADSTVTRVVGRREGYRARLARAGTDCYLEQTISLLNGQLRGETINASVLCTTSTAGAATLEISDGITTSTSTAHTGGGTEETLTVSDFAIAATATDLVIRCRMDTSNGNADFEQVIAVELASIPPWLSDDGSTAAKLVRVPHEVYMGGTAPSIRVHHPIGRKSQLYVATRQAYFKLTTDTRVTDMPLEALIAGSIVRLASDMWLHEDRTRPDRLLTMWAPKDRNWRRVLRETVPVTLADDQAIVSTL